MEKNMGTIDRIIRTVLAVIVVILYLTGTISGAVAIILGILAAIFIATSIVGYCPLYTPLKRSGQHWFPVVSYLTSRRVLSPTSLTYGRI